MSTQTNQPKTIAETKICKDCRYSRDMNLRFPKCTADEVAKRDLVTGEHLIRCSDARDAFAACGPQARLFELELRIFPDTAVIIYGKPGSGKSADAPAMLALFKKEVLIDPWSPGSPLPSNALALTNAWVPGCIDYSQITSQLSSSPAL